MPAQPLPADNDAAAPEMPEPANDNASPASSEASAGGMEPANDNGTPESFDDEKISQDYNDKYLPSYHKARADHLSRNNSGKTPQSKVTQSGNVTKLDATTQATSEGGTSAVPTPANDNGTPFQVENVSGSGQGAEASKVGDNKIKVELKADFLDTTGYPPPLSLAEYSKLARQGNAPTGEENVGGAMPQAPTEQEPQGEEGAEPTAGEETPAGEAPTGNLPVEKDRSADKTKQFNQPKTAAPKEAAPEGETAGETPPTPSPETTPAQGGGAGPHGAAPTKPRQQGGPTPPGEPPTEAPAEGEPGEQPEEGAPAEGEPGEGEPGQKKPEGETAPEGQAGEEAKPGAGEKAPAGEGVPAEGETPGAPPSVGPGQSEEVAEGLGKAPKEPEKTPAEGAPPAAEGTTPGEASPGQQQDAGISLNRRRQQLERQRASLRAKLDQLNGKITNTRKSKELQIIKFFLPKLYNQVSGAFSNVELKSQEALVMTLQTKVGTLSTAKKALQAAEGIAAFIDAVIQWVRWIIYTSESIIGAIIIALLCFIIVPMLFFEKLSVAQGGLTGAVKKVVKDVDEILEPMQKQLTQEKRKLVYIRKIHQIDIELGGGEAANIGGAGKKGAPAAGGNGAEGEAPGAPGEPPKAPGGGMGLASSPKVPSGGGTTPPKMPSAA